MSDVDQHVEAHRLKRDLGYGARRIGQELGITRHAATLLLSQPLAAPVAEPVAEVAAGGSQTAAAVAASDGERRPEARQRLPRRLTDQPLAGLDEEQERAVRRDLAVLAQSGCTPDVLLTQAVAALAYGYRLALDRGQLERGQPFMVTAMRLRPHAQLADRPVA
ncbi:hypothetical protein AB0E00_36810 [Streptomyces sp. NPDC048110]|uniref:hypothetical protein n=1 Tax=Streptomyces sp. NPDC048110 TaxID=3155483 RepID=UPI0033FBDB17